MLVATNLVSSFFLTVYNVTQMSMRQQICPPELLGRLNATFRFAVWGVMPIGALLSGLVAARIGVVWAMLVFVVGTILSGLAMGLTPVARVHRIPLCQRGRLPLTA
ncbi:MAG: hypothetical protein L0J79_06745 [Propionibacterium sp.]|nr:hypothetical protein [Propionibacterium sp.]